MKKIVSILLALVTVLSMGTMAFADGTTTLTTTVPDAAYTLNIPADQKVEFNTVKHKLAVPTVTEASGFAVGKNLLVTVSKTDFACEGVSTTIPYSFNAKGDGIIIPLKEITYLGDEKGAVGSAMTQFESQPRLSFILDSYLEFEKSNWGKALAGDYTATITFTSEVVAG